MIGSILITAALAASVFTTIMYYYSLKGYKNTVTYARYGYNVSSVFIIVASTILLNAILNHQYQYRYVYEYSGSDLPMGLLLSTFYAGQEGSFLVWVLFASLTGLFLLQYTIKREGTENSVMFVYSVIMTLLIAMVSPLLKNPFEYIWNEPLFLNASSINSALIGIPQISNFIFNDQQTNQTFVQMNAELYSILQGLGISLNDFIIQGKGLNPLLQNFWMQIHPPMLFIGFALAAVPFSFALGALIRNEYKTWIKHSFPWTIAASMILGLAIMLGGYWAYGVLGWGGYWGWDPVENSSLVPWLISVALIHTMLVQKRSIAKNGEGIGEFAKTNIVLALFTFILIVYSTFLTRSGILSDASVHSFVDPGYIVYLFLIIMLFGISLFGLGFLAYRWKYLTIATEQYKSLLNRELALFTGSVALVASAIIILLGTSSPIFGTSVEIKFYNELNLPIAIIIGLLNGFSLILKWKQTDDKDLKKSLLTLSLISLIISAGIIILGNVNDFMLMLLTFSSIFCLVVNVEIIYKIIRGKKIMLGAYIAHIGLAFFFLGVIGSGAYSEEINVDLPKNEPVEVFGYSLTFTGYEPFDDGKKYFFNIDIQKGNSSSTVRPVMYVAEFNNSLMREPDIWSGLTKDFYVAPAGYNPGEQNAPITLIQDKPIEYNNAKITFDGFDFPDNAMELMMAGGDFQIGTKISIEQNGEIYKVDPAMKSSKGVASYESADITEANMRIILENLDASGKSISVRIVAIDGSELGVSSRELLSINASVKPFVSFVWIGVIVIVAGYILSMLRRQKEST